jgi:hypothetical protein
VAMKQCNLLGYRNLHIKKRTFWLFYFLNQFRWRKRTKQYILENDALHSLWENNVHVPFLDTLIKKTVYVIITNKAKRIKTDKQCLPLWKI